MCQQRIAPGLYEEVDLVLRQPKSCLDARELFRPRTIELIELDLRDLERDIAATPVRASAQSRRLGAWQAAAPASDVGLPIPDAEAKCIEPAAHRGVDGGIGDRF